MLHESHDPAQLTSTNISYHNFYLYHFLVVVG